MSYIQNRIDSLRKAMREKGLSAYIIPGSDPHQSEYVADKWKGREWISGFTGSAGDIVITMDHAGLFTDSRYFIQAEQELSDSEFVLHRMGAGAPGFFTWAWQQLGAGDKIGLDGQLFSDTQVRSFRKSCAGKGIALDIECDLLDLVWTDRPPLPDGEIFLHDPKYAGADRREKFAAIRRQMDESGAAVYLVTALDDIAWAFNIRGRDVEYNPVAIAFASVEKNKARLFIEPEKVPEAIRQQLKEDGVEIHSYDAFSSYVKSAQGPIFYDPKKTNAYLAGQIDEGVDVVTGDSFVMHLKAIKNETEQAWIRKVMVKDGIALTHAYKWLEDTLRERGVTEVEMAEQIARFRAEQDGYFGESFSAIIGFQGNGAIVHYRPMPDSCKTITAEGILLTDSGGQYVDGTTDITRTLALGPVSDTQKKHYTLVLKGHIGLATSTFPEGTTGAQLDMKAREHLWHHGLNFGHGTGHGVGFFLNVHEPPQGFVPNLSERGYTPQRAGHFSSNEPGYYVEGSHGIRIENLVICQPHPEHKGFLHLETVTLFPIDTALIDKALMTNDEIQWLNEYHKRVYEALSPGLDNAHKAWLANKCEAI